MHIDAVEPGCGCGISLPVGLDPIARLDAATGFSLGFPSDFITQTRSWVLGAAAL